MENIQQDLQPQLGSAVTSWRKLGHRLACYALVCAWLLACADAELPESARGKAIGGKQVVEEWFRAAAPAAGEQLPDLQLVDATGAAVKLREVASGQYTVLVLGCLT